MFDIRPAVTPGDIEAARALFEHYAASLDVDLCFQDFETELTYLPGAYAPPRGTLLLGWNKGRAIGCIALRPLDDPSIAELKRLYVRPEGRGFHLGRQLSEHALAFAREAGYQRVRLDTLTTMRQAQHLYAELGFREIEPYGPAAPLELKYMELDLMAQPVN